MTRLPPFVSILLLSLLYVCYAQTVRFEAGNSAHLDALVENGRITYTVRITAGTGDDVWLEGAPIAVHCNKEWYSADDRDVKNGVKALELINAIVSSGIDPTMGSYRQLQVEWKAGSLPVLTTFRHLTEEDANDALVFNTSFPQGCPDSEVKQPRRPSSVQRSNEQRTASKLGYEREFNSTILSLSEFPSFTYTDGSRLETLSHITWRGRFSHDYSTHNQSINLLMGGTEGGPLVLFDNSKRRTDAFVISSLDGFMEGMLSVRDWSHSSSSQTGADDTCDTCTSEVDVDYYANDLYQVDNVTSAEECCQLCRQEPGCRYYSWLGQDPAPYTNQCCLKTSDIGRTPHKGHTSGRVCDKTLAFGIQGGIASVASGQSQPFILVPTLGSGINAAMVRWGSVLQKQHKTWRLDAKQDLVSSKLGYWTDNGGYFYSGNPLSTSNAIDVLGNLSNQGVPIGYMQLDPFWYPVGGYPTCGNGCEHFVPRPDLYPNGLEPIFKFGGIPLLLYSSFFCPDSGQYYPDYTFLKSDYFDIGFDKTYIATVKPEQSKDFYNLIMSNYTQNGLMRAFEVDFMDFNFLTFPQFTTVAGAFETWATGMNDAALGHNMSVQYCMGLAHEMLMALKLPAVTNARASEDNFPNNENRWQIGYTGLLYGAVALRPFMDVIWTVGHQPNNPYNMDRDNVLLQAMVATLSMGPVGIGDGPGMTNVTLVKQIARADARLIHPSYPATPIDVMYYPPSLRPSGEIWQTHASLNDGVYVAYSVFVVDVVNAYSLQYDDLWPAPSATSYLAYQGLQGCVKGQAWTTCATQMTGSQPLSINTGEPAGKEHSIGLTTLAPQLLSGRYFLGVEGPFVAHSANIITSVADSSSTLTITIDGIKGETLTLWAVDPSGELDSKTVTPTSDGPVTVSFS